MRLLYALALTVLMLACHAFVSHWLHRTWSTAYWVIEVLITFFAAAAVVWVSLGAFFLVTAAETLAFVQGCQETSVAARRES